MIFLGTENRYSASAGRGNRRGFNRSTADFSVRSRCHPWKTTTCQEFDECHNIQRTEQGKGKVPSRRKNPGLLDDGSANSTTEKLKQVESSSQQCELAVSLQEKRRAHVEHKPALNIWIYTQNTGLIQTQRIWVADYCPN
jgi:hypothetical protein